MKVLYRKQNQIRKSLGIYIPIADNDSTLMESIMEEIIVLDTKKEFIKQPTLLIWSGLQKRLKNMINVFNEL